MLGGAAGQYLLLAAEFVALTQVLVYIGAVTVLFLFGTMLTRAQIGKERDLNNRNWMLGIPVALLLLGTLGYVLIDSYHGEQLPDPGGSTSTPADQRLDLPALPDPVLGAVVRAPRRRHRRHRPRSEGLNRC